MRVHHLNCGSMHPFGLPRDDGRGGFFTRGSGVIHCLLAETDDGLVLIDTGWGLRDCEAPSPVVRQFAAIVRAPLDRGETAACQVEGLGFERSMVRHIFLTHLHLDHAGGLPDFPEARVHVWEAELAAYNRPVSLVERNAYRPEHTAHGPRWMTHKAGGDLWFGLPSAPPVHIGETEVVMLPFTGHTRGHCAIALRDGSRWRMDCGDAYGYFKQVDATQPYTHPNGRLMEALVTGAFKIPRGHWQTLRNLLRAHGDEIEAFCTHDAREYKASKEGKAVRTAVNGRG